MKFLLVSLLFCSSFYSQSKDEIPPNIQKEIDKGIDYYNLSLYDESKKIFLNLLYSDNGEKYEAEIRYHLGVSSFYEKKLADAKIQWKILIKKFPTNKHSKSLRRTADRWSSIKDEGDSFKEENREFLDEKNFGEYFWDSGKAEYKLIFGELKDPSVAVKYHEKLYEKYDDPNKKFEISLILFQLYSGINENKYGYKNQSTYGTAVSDDPYKSLTLAAFTQKTAEILNQMENNLTGEFDINNATFILANYLWAVRLSDSEFWSEKAKSNISSEPYFAKVITLTNVEPNNIYRLFSIMYLGENAKKYVISEELLSEYKSYGITSEDVLGFINKGIPQELWVEIKQRNLDYSLSVNSLWLVRSLKLEKLLKKYNFISTYTFEDLQNNIQNIEKWSSLFVSPNFPTSNESLMSIIYETFNCENQECVIKNKNVIKQNIVREIGKLSRKKKEDQNFVSFLPVSTLLILKKNKISAEDFAKIYIENRKVLWP